MPAPPPETKFYENDANSTLWRDVSRLFEDFCGDDESKWPEREKRFEVVLEDVLVKLRESEKAHGN